MKSIIIFGLGNGRLEVEKNLDRDNFNIIGYSDSISQIIFFNNKPFISMTELANVEFDIIIIAIRDRDIRNTIKDILIKDIRIKEEKIVLYYEMIDSYMKVDRIFQTAKSPFEGIILGMSHAEVGIIPEMFPFRCCNLAISSQDIYYNYKSLQYVVDNYYKKLKLKYLLIDIYDYYWLNNDLSLTKNVYSYICNQHGYRLDKHNINRNKNITNEQKTNIDNIIQKKVNTFKIFRQKEWTGGYWQIIEIDV